MLTVLQTINFSCQIILNHHYHQNNCAKQEETFTKHEQHESLRRKLVTNTTEHRPPNSTPEFQELLNYFSLRRNGVLRNNYKCRQQQMHKLKASTY